MSWTGKVETWVLAQSVMFRKEKHFGLGYRNTLFVSKINSQIYLKHVDSVSANHRNVVNLFLLVQTIIAQFVEEIVNI